MSTGITSSDYQYESAEDDEWVSVSSRRKGTVAPSATKARKAEAPVGDAPKTAAQLKNQRRKEKKKAEKTESGSGNGTPEQQQTVVEQPFMPVPKLLTIPKSHIVEEHSLGTKFDALPMHELLTKQQKLEWEMRRREENLKKKAEKERKKAAALAAESKPFVPVESKKTEETTVKQQPTGKKSEKKQEKTEEKQQQQQQPVPVSVSPTTTTSTTPPSGPYSVPHPLFSDLPLPMQINILEGQITQSATILQQFLAAGISSTDPRVQTIVAQTQMAQQQLQFLRTQQQMQHLALMQLQQQQQRPTVQPQKTAQPLWDGLTPAQLAALEKGTEAKKEEAVKKEKKEKKPKEKSQQQQQSVPKVEGDQSATTVPKPKREKKKKEATVVELAPHPFRKDGYVIPARR